MARGNLRAQSILEYVIVLTAIVAIILYAAANWIGGQSGGVRATIGNAATAIEKAADKIAPPIAP